MAPVAAAEPAAAAPAKPVCPAQLPDENAALTTARLCGEPVAISGMTTQTDQAVATPSGIVQWEHHYRPVRVPSKHGWEPVDTTLRAHTGGTVAPAATAVAMSFSGGGKTPMVTVTEGKNSFEVRSPFGALPTPVLDGDTATYPDVLAGVDLQLRADVDGYTQVLVVKDRQAAQNPKLARLAFGISGDGVITTADKAGNLRVTDGKGKLVLAGNTPLMWDTAPSSGKGSKSKPMPATVEGGVLSVTPNAAMLDDPATVFPVYIDPGVTLNRSSWALVDSATASTTYWNSAGSALVGTSNAGASVKRSFFNVDLASTAVAGKYVTAAGLNLDVNGSASCTARQVDLYTTGAATAATTWNNQPAWTALQSSQTLAKGFDASCPAGPINMDATSGVRAAAIAGTSTLTLGVRAANETDNSYAKTFGNNPTLTVSYTAYPTVAELMTSPSTPCQTGTNRPYLNTVTPLLQARITDPEGALVRPEFSWSTTGGTPIGSAQPTPGQASGQQQATTVPAGAFSNGGSYSWKVRGFDGTTWGPWSVPCEFTVDTTVPTAAPTVSSTVYPSGSWAGAAGTAGTFTLGAASVSDIAAYVYGLDTDPTTVVNTGTLGANATITLTPTADGPHTLKVQSRDRGGNLSPVKSYVFNVGTGAVTAPTTGTQTAAKVTLSGISKTTSSGITYQWRRGNADTWTTIPTADVTTTVGGAINWPVATTGSGAYPNLVWNVAQTVNNAEPGATALDGPVQVRASLSGTSSGTSTGVMFTLDQNKTDAATTMVGPGLVNLLTGSYTIGATDASGIGGLALQRTFNTRQATAIDPMFGPGWTSSIAAPTAGTYTELTVTGSLAQVGLADGSTLGFTKTTTTSGGATFTAEVGGGNTQLAYTSSNDTYTLSEASGDTVSFTRRTGDPAGLYTPTSLQAAGTSTTSTISWQKATLASGDVVRPTQVLAPIPSGVNCTTLVKGCRALTFTYAATTTATGSTPGDYTGRLTQVALTAWDPDLSTPAMRTVTMQQYTYDTNGRLAQAWDPRLDYSSGGTQHVTTAYNYNTNGTIAALTPPAEQPWSFTYTTLPTDPGAGRLYKVTRSALSAGTSVESIVYNIPVSGGTGPIDMAANITRWGQTAVPVDATSVYPGDIVPDGNPATGTLPSNTNDDRVTVHYMDPNGREINTMQPGGAIDASFYDAYGNLVRQTAAANITGALYASDTDNAAAEATLARAESMLYTYSGDGQRLLEVLSPEQDTVLTDWSTVRGRTHTVYTYDENAPTGGPYALVTTRVEALQYTVSGAVIDTDKRTTTTTYDWTLRQPLTETVDPNGLALTTRTSYDSATGQVTAATTPAGNTAGTTPSTRKVTYYRAGAGSGNGDCDNHPEWTMLPCLTTVGAQPSSGSQIPSTLITYNIDGQPSTALEKNSSDTLRTVTISYDGAGRSRDLSITSSLGKAVAKQHSVYAQGTGYLTGTQTLDADGNITASISRGYDTLGRPTTYTDADGNISTTSYDQLSRTATTNDGKATQTLTYNGGGEKRGLATQAVDSQAGTISVTYNVDSAVDTETRPDGITVRHYYNENGQPTGLEYVTDPACSTASCTLYYDYTGSDTHDKVRWDASSFSDSGHGYDNAGRLTGARQDTTTGCALRDYKFDNASNRTKLTSYGPDTAGACQDSNPATTRTWTYDDADRATNTGYTYDTLGRTLTMPDDDSAAGDGAGDVTNTYYTNDMARTITQNTTTTTYTLDVLLNRYRSYSTNTGGTTVDHTNHYVDDTDSPAWIADAGWYTRKITGPVGVSALYTGAVGHLEWQITNLHGDIVAMRTAGATGLTATYTTDEYGKAVASSSTPRYGYLGKEQRSSDNPGGLVAMGIRLFNPTTGRFLSTDPVYGGNANAYDYCSADAVNCADTSGAISIPCYKDRYKRSSKWGVPYRWEWWFHCNLTHAQVTYLTGAAEGGSLIGEVKQGLKAGIKAATAGSEGGPWGSALGFTLGLIASFVADKIYTARCTNNRGVRINGYLSLGYIKWSITFSCR
jgi:RHS repeat-associated protein